MTQETIELQIIALREATKKATKSKAAARKYLQDAGIIKPQKTARIHGQKETAVLFSEREKIHTMFENPLIDEQIRALRAATKKATQSKEAAIKYLVSAGIINAR